jgi:hypothetical protein
MRRQMKDMCVCQLGLLLSVFLLIEAMWLLLFAAFPVLVAVISHSLTILDFIFKVAHDVQISFLRERLRPKIDYRGKHVFITGALMYPPLLARAPSKQKAKFSVETLSSTCTRWQHGPRAGSRHQVLLGEFFFSQTNALMCFRHAPTHAKAGGQGGDCVGHPPTHPLI